MRADRLVATLLLMQTRGRVTAAELAGELEVSVATARRDLEALAAAGVPVYPQPGRNGGWHLVGGARTDLTGLTAGEARTLFLLIGSGGAAGAGTPEARSALRKLGRALPATFRAEAEAAATAVVVDSSRWGRAAAGLPEVAEPLQDAVIRRHRVRIGYTDREGRRSDRTVDPWGLVGKDGTWYLVAGTARGRRSFRVDRIAAAEVLAETFDRPAGLDLAAEWDEVAGDVERRFRGGVVAEVLAPPRLVRVLTDVLGRHCVPDGEHEDGRARLLVSAHTPRAVAEQLAGFGRHVEVLSPPEVRAHLAAIGTELTSRYTPTPPGQATRASSSTP